MAATEQLFAAPVSADRRVVDFLARSRKVSRETFSAHFSGLWLRGRPVYSCPAMAESRVLRSWAERLFTRPWRPWRRFARKVEHGVLLLWHRGDYVYVAHPSVVAGLVILLAGADDENWDYIQAGGRP